MDNIDNNATPRDLSNMLIYIVFIKNTKLYVQFIAQKFDFCCG